MIQKMSEVDRIYVEKVLHEEFNTSFPQENPFFNVLLYKNDSEICGFVCYDMIYEKLEIEYIYVEPKYRRQQVATKLIQKMIAEAKIHGVNSISLEVNEHNHSAQCLYKKMGFKIGSIRKKYYGNDDGILMVRKLI